MAVVATLVALAVVSVVVAQVSSLSHRRLAAEAPEEAVEVDWDAGANRLASVLLGTPGQSWFLPNSCVNGIPDPSRMTADSVTLPGLAREPCGFDRTPYGFNLSFDKLANLRDAPLPAAMDNYLNYWEAQPRLKLGDRHFHLTSRIVVQDTATLLANGHFDPNLRILYIGDYEDPPGPHAPSAPQTSAIVEASYLASLTKRFNPRTPSLADASGQIPYDPAGDVLPDYRPVLSTQLPTLLLDASDAGTTANYDTVIIGSNLLHSEMTAEAIKGTIQKWVNSGGTLIVVGSTATSYAWLMSLYNAQLRSDLDDGPFVVVDPDHELLTSPNLLIPEDYENYETGWRVAGADRDRFDYLVTLEGEAVLAVSGRNEYGTGRVILTAYRPFDMDGSGGTGACAAPAQASCPGLQFFHNLLTLGYDDIVIDYGPSPPTGHPYGTVTRLVAVYHPKLATVVELNVKVDYF